MKRFIFFVVLFFGTLGLLFAQQPIQMGNGEIGTLQRAERLTSSEIIMLCDAQGKVRQADNNLIQIKKKIAIQHNMYRANWMEYRSWYEFDGGFILQRYQSAMTTTIETSDFKVGAN